MTYKEFPIWLEGVFDANPDGLDKKQIDFIRAKMKTLTFPKETSKDALNMTYRC